MKLFSFIKFKFLASLQFRSEIIVWLLLDFIPFIVLFLLFTNLFENTDTIRGLSFQQTIEYYFLAAMIQGLTSTHFESWRAEEIRLGKIDFFLIRPFSYLKEIMISDIAAKLFYLTLFAPTYIIFFVIVRQALAPTLFSDVSWQMVGQFSLLLGLAYGIQLMIGSCITLLTFWFEGADGLQHFKWLAITILSGALIPIEFMPASLQSVVTLLPFKYLYAIPIGILQGRVQLQPSDGVLLVGTLVGMWLTTRLLLTLGLLKYSSTGG